jgi:DNA-binding GntR family transcriptional regulator
MSDGATRRAKREHAHLLALCRAGDAEGAAQLTLAHVLAVRHDLLQLLQPDEAGLADHQAPAAPPFSTNSQD